MQWKSSIIGVVEDYQISLSLKGAGLFFTVYLEGGNLILLRKTKIDDVTPAKAGVQSEKLDSRFRGNDKYCFRNRY